MGDQGFADAFRFFVRGHGIRRGSGAKQTDGWELFDWRSSLPGMPTPSAADIMLWKNKEKTHRKARSPLHLSHLSFGLEVKKRKKERKKLKCFFCFCTDVYSEAALIFLFSFLVYYFREV